MKNSSSIRISIPKPCSMKWEEMLRVNEDHRQCSSCNRVLADFSMMSDDELVLYFKHSNGKTCGRFATSQLNRDIVLLPERSVKTQWWKSLLLVPATFFAGNVSAQTSSTKTVNRNAIVNTPGGYSRFIQHMDDTLLSDSLPLVKVVAKLNDPYDGGYVVGRLPAVTVTQTTACVRAGLARRIVWRIRNFLHRIFHH